MIHLVYTLTPQFYDMKLGFERGYTFVDTDFFLSSDDLVWKTNSLV